MSNIEADLLQSQSHILSVLEQYQKSSEEVILSSYSSHLYSLLEAIASLDHQKINLCESHFHDQVALQYIRTIANNLKTAKPQESPSPEPKKVEEVTRQSKIAPKKEEKKGSGIFEFVRSKFTSKEKKATEMIFPEKQPKCEYDPKTKSWIFQGEEPEAPKVIPKPPSAAEKKPKEEVKKSEEGELGQLTAPPAFKRKSTPGVQKGKAKIKQEKELPKASEEPLTYAKVKEFISESFTNILQKVRSGVYQLGSSAQEPHNLADFMKVAQKTFEVSAEIGMQQSRVIERWGKILTSQNRELKIMEKVIKEMSDSASAYSLILSKFDKTAKQQGQRPTIQILPQSTTVIGEMDPQKQAKSLQDLESQKTQLRNAQEYIFELKARIIRMLQDKERQEEVKSGFKEELREMKGRIIGKDQIINQLTNKNEEVSNHCLHLQSQIKEQKSKYSQHSTIREQAIKALEQEVKRLTSYTKEENSLHFNYLSQIEKNEAKIKGLQKENNQLNEEKHSLQYQLKLEKAKAHSNSDRVNQELVKQRSKVQSQLKLYQEKQKIYLLSIKNLQQHENIMHEYESALNQENQLLNSILEKRLQLSKHTQNEQFLFRKQPEPSSHSIILELSDIVNSITQTHLDRLQAFNRSYSKLHKKYMQSKELANKIKSTASSENMSLHRNVTRLKSLLETEKNAKEESQERCSQLQLECDKLKKRLAHYKEQDQFNKSYLSKLKTSKINSQNQSVLSLQEDNEELASEIEYLHKELEQKAEALKKNQSDLEDLLVNYEKNQVRLLDTERKYKESEREMKGLRQSIEEEANKNRLLQLKLQHQKERYDEIQSREESRLKNSQSNFQKKLKLLKNEIDQAASREQHLRYEKQELERQLNEQQQVLKESKITSEDQLNKLSMQHEKQMHDITVLLDQTNEELIAAKDQQGHLLRENEQLKAREKQLQGKLEEIVDEHLKQISIQQKSQQNLENIITALIEKHNCLEQESASFEREYNEKIIGLQTQLNESSEIEQLLLSQIQEDSSLVENLSQKIASLKSAQETNKKVYQVSKQNERLKGEIDYLKSELQAKANERNELEQIIEKMSDDMARQLSGNEQLNKAKTDLEERLMFKEREIQTLTNENNAKSEQLMIKTQELSQKDRLMLQREEASVMNKEEFDQLMNQMQKMKQQVSRKDDKIRELQVDLEFMAQQLQEVKGVDEETFQKEIDYLKQIISLKEQEIKILLEEMDNLKDQTDRLNIEVNAAKEEREDMKAKEKALNQEIDSRQTNINDLTNKVSQKQEEIQLLLSQLQQAEKEIKKQISESGEFQGEMQELVDEIDSLEKQLKDANELKDSLENVIEEMGKDLSTQQSLVSQLKNKCRLATEQNKKLQTQVSQLLSQIGSLEKEKIQLTELVETLENELESGRQAMKKEEKEDGRVIEELISDIRIKDELLIEKQRQIQEKEKIIIKLSADSTLQQEQLREAKRTCSEKGKSLTEAQIAEQEKIRIIVQLQKTIKEYEQRCKDLEVSLSQMADIMEKQEKTIQSINSSSKASEQIQLRELRNTVNLRNTQVAQLKKSIQEITRRVTEKEGEYEKKIQSLEREIIGLNSLKNGNKRLEETLKGLQEENRTLLNEKVELIKSNNYLVGINQKLVLDKSPHNNKESKEAPKTQSSLPQGKVQPRQPSSEIKEQKGEPKGFLGAISSLFLTPTQTDRLRK